MEKLGIIREDITPTENIVTGKVAFECDNETTGEAALVKRAEDEIEDGSQKIQSLLTTKNNK